MCYIKLVKYIFSAIFKQEIGGYSVLCPELGVASQGKTIKEAENNIHEAVELYINDMSKNDLESYARSLNEVPMVKTFEVSHV